MFGENRTNKNRKEHFKMKQMKKKNLFFSRIIMMALIMAMLTGCGKKAPQQPEPEAPTVIDLTGSANASASSEATTASQTPSVAEATTPAIDEDGVYTTKEDVALYLHTYGKLPGNFITKKAAKKLGWSGGSLEDYAPGKCIGGDYFGNYEGLLPEDKEYHECDIGTLGKKSRGAKRIIYSDDGYIYYTADHYESFELLYEPQS